MNILITGAWTDAEAHFAEVEALGHKIAFLPWEQDPLPCDPAWVEGVVCNGLFLHHKLEEFPNLRWIQLTSAGLDRVPEEEIRRRRITLCNARGVYSVPMAEFALCGVLQLYKQAARFRENQKRHVWERRRGLGELWGKTVAVLGCGSVGSECAARFRAMGCKVIGVDLFPREDRRYDRMLPLDGLDELLPTVDVLILCLPLTPETRGTVNAARLAQLKPGAVLVNIARGPIADEAAVCEALRTGRLAGAVLDVFETEPLAPDSPLWDLETVILTPHNSFAGEGNSARLARRILDDLPASENR